MKMQTSDFSNKRRWSIVILLFAGSLINYLDRAAISFALPANRDLHHRVRPEERRQEQALALHLIERTNTVAKGLRESTSLLERGTVSRPRDRMSPRKEAAPSGPRPTETSENTTSRSVSTSSNRFTSASTKPQITLAGSSSAVLLASRLARIVPLSQPKWR